MTKQEVFDKVAKHLLTQGVKSKLPNSASSCAYRGVDGTMCAVGCLIPDEMYDPSMEGGRVFELFKNHPEVKEYLKVDQDFLQLLQDIHDSVPVEFWEDSLRNRAKSYNLEFSV